MNPRWTWTLAAAFLALTAFPARAHLCDDVWRQVDKLVLKPDVTNLVVKDKAEFDVHMQHNMDRGIACYVKLLGECPAFDIQITPEAGHPNVMPGKRYIYHVTLTTKPGQTSGNYPITFRVMGTYNNKPREFTSTTFSLGGASAPAAAPAEAKANAVPAVGSATLAIDGNPNEPCWRKIAEKFQTGPGNEPQKGTAVRACCDGRNLYLSFVCRGVVPENRGADDSVTVLLARPGQTDRAIQVTLTSTGAATAQERRQDRMTPLANAKVQAAAMRMQGVWFGEMAIPASLLGFERIEKDQTWLVNLVRESKVEPAETSFWVGKADTYQNAERFAELSLQP